MKLSVRAERAADGPAILDRLKGDGVALVFVLGDPGYYRRFGFSAEAAKPFTAPWTGDAFQALWLAPAAPRGGGPLHYPEAFLSSDT